MSRSLTAAQVIGLGEYLNPNFDPASLTVSQLLGVLGFHNIQYPTPYSKPKLIQLFTDEITAKSARLKRERHSKEQSLASDDGITDGLTGRPIGKETKPLARRSSRRLSRANSEDEAAAERPEPAKRRRSSAQPTFGGTSRRTVPSQPALVEESEPEEDEVIVRKAARSKKSSNGAGSQSRRISAADDSGWEDNNIFQSGAESSSPVRPSPSKPKGLRKSASTRKSRKSMSAPPTSPSSSPAKAPEFAERLKLAQESPTFKFEPSLPPSFSRESRAAANRAKRSSFVPVAAESPASVAPATDDESEEDELDVIGDGTSASNNKLVTAIVDELDDEQFEEDDQTVAVSRRIAQGGSLVPAKPRAHSTSWLLRFLFALIAVASSAAVVTYKMESATIGYCDTGKSTNKALEALNAKWDAIEACNRENRTFLHLPHLTGSDDSVNADAEPILCPPPAIIPFLHATYCTPCPEHATCSDSTVKCDNGFLHKLHPLLNLLSPFGSAMSGPAVHTRNFIADVTNGLPGLGPVAFPERCVEDPERKRHIGALGKAIEALLGQERGMRLCAGDGLEVFANRDGGEAKNWGMEIGQLKEVMKKKTSPQLLSTFDDTFNEAVQQLVQWGGVILGEDTAGKRYLAHKTPNLTWNCAITVKSREVWAEWRATVLAITVLIVSGFLTNVRRSNRAVENKRVAELVQIALDTLRNQEMAHHTDPITAPQPYLSSLQLRDLILQDEHSISLRRRLWDQVERVVEGNANVRANLEEVHGGDELRVWRWVGGAGRSPGLRKKVQFEDGGQVVG